MNMKRTAAEHAGDLSQHLPVLENLLIVHVITIPSEWALEEELLRTSNVDKVVLIKFLANGKEEPVRHNKP